MKSAYRWLKVLAFAACAGTLWGTGGCLPDDFFSALLADSIIATAVSTIAGGVAGTLLPA